MWGRTYLGVWFNEVASPVLVSNIDVRDIYSELGVDRVPVSGRVAAKAVSNSRASLNMTAMYETVSERLIETSKQMSCRID